MSELISSLSFSFVRLTLHAENKHNSTLAQCFPNWQDPGK
jgi:hypothetical protein